MLFNGFGFKGLLYRYPIGEALLGDAAANGNCILMVDTEGNDALALKGSANMLSRQMVRCLIFEYHFFGQWEFHKLADVVQHLSQDGYDCFFQGQKRLWALSNGCWHDLEHVSFKAGLMSCA